MGELGKIIERARGLIHESIAFDREGISRKKAFLLYQVRLWIHISRNLVADRALQQASSLAYQTILSLVPTVAVALSLLKAFGAFSGPDTPLVRFVARIFLPPDKAQTLAVEIIQYSKKIQFGAIGGIGLAALVLVALVLMDTVDKTINDIWKVRRRRNVFVRFTIYYAVLTLGPLLFAVSLYQTARFQVGGGIDNPHVTPILTTWSLLLLTYKLFPNTKVNWWPALFGAFFAAVGFEIVKFGFNLFLTSTLSSNYTKIYGALAIIPLFFMWIYVVWIIVLFGVEYSYTVQNLRHLVRKERDAIHRRSMVGRLVPSGPLACRIVALVAGRHDRGEQPPSEGEIAGALSVPMDVVHMAVDRLTARGILLQATQVGEGDSAEPGLVPGASLRALTMLEVLTSFEDEGRYLGKDRAGQGVERWLDEYLGCVETCAPGWDLLRVLDEDGSGEGAHRDGQPSEPTEA